MSLVQYHKCDHCGKRLDEMRDYIDVEIDKYGLIVADLCVKCYEELSDLITVFLNLKQKNNEGTK